MWTKNQKVLKKELEKKGYSVDLIKEILSDREGDTQAEEAVKGDWRAVNGSLSVYYDKKYETVYFRLYDNAESRWRSVFTYNFKEGIDKRFFHVEDLPDLSGSVDDFSDFFNR